MEYSYYWFIASLVFFLLEALGASGIGLLFAALAAFCIGILLQTGLLGEADYLAQGGIFFILTALWALLLWKPLKAMRLAKTAQHHHDMIGRLAVVGDAGLAKGKKSGQVRWSGTTMRARLADDAAIDIAAGGEELKIVAVDGSTLILAQKDYPLPEAQ